MPRVKEVLRAPDTIRYHDLFRAPASVILTPDMSGKYDDIYAMVAAIPEGKLATYGQIALLTGRANGARQVGYALAASREQEIPWHRVINAKGQVSARRDSGYEDYQRILLEEEGIEFDLRGRVDLAHYRWAGPAAH